MLIDGIHVVVKTKIRGCEDVKICTQSLQSAAVWCCALQLGKGSNYYLVHGTLSSRVQLHYGALESEHRE